jgi:3-deoxy-7-phosphoheptulonate synthase
VVLVGPRLVYNLESIREYAKLLAPVANRLQKDLCIVMHCYVEEPHTVRGWKGLINDPHLDESFDINNGLRLVRQLFVEITDMGLPLATELVGALSPLYLAELLSISAIGPSSLHRELASSVPFPVGFRATENGTLQAATDAITVASTEHHFISVTPEGRTAIAWTRGNENCFVIVGRCLSSSELMRQTKEKTVVMVDSSTGMLIWKVLNSPKDLTLRQM